MPVVFDASFLVPLLDKRAAVDGSIRRRLAKLTSDIQAARDRILIPTPALAEFLTKVDDPVAYLDLLSRTRYFEIVPFDERAAIDLAASQAGALAAGDKRSGIPAAEAPWQKVKFDRQIVAIAVTQRAAAIYSNDPHLATYAGPTEIPVIRLADLPPPDEPDLFDDAG